MTVRKNFFLVSVIAVLLFFQVQEIQASKTYKVKPGDTLISIAAATGVDPRELRRLNNLTSDLIRPNQTLRLSAANVNQAGQTARPAQAAAPAARSVRPAQTTEPAPVASSYVVKRGDNLARIARTTGISIAQIKQANNLTSDRLTVGKTLLLPGRSRPAAAVALSPSPDDGFDEEGDGEILSEDGWAAIERDKQEASDLLGKWRNPQERTSLVKAANLFLGAPYRFGGETVRGIDCSAFVRAVYGVFGIQLPRTAREQSFVGMVVGRDSLKEGDLVFFNTRRALGHVGIYIGDNKFLHASYRSKAVRVDSMETPYFQKRFVRAVRIKELEEEWYKSGAKTPFPR